MGDFVIKNGDQIQITIDPPALVPQLLPPVALIGSSTNLLIAGSAACLEGDELPPSIQTPLQYMAPPYTTPGMGTLQIVLSPDNLTTKTPNGKSMLLKGGTFKAIFNVQAPAMMPTPAGPQPDPMMVKQGTAQFITTNTTVMAS